MPPTTDSSSSLSCLPHPPAASPPWPKRITLTGFMGCGKTTLGKKLAKRLGYTFIDTDQLIEHQQGAKTSDLFSIHGEAYFRTLEQQALAEVLQRDRCVIATGGGALARQPNLQWALEQSTVVYLELPFEELLERVLFSPKDRPLVDVKDPETVVHQLFQSRLPFYQQAHITLCTYKLSPHESIAKLIQALA
ncbi:MAG: shikimate kinase [Vampirovibrionales bacterium]